MIRKPRQIVSAITLLFMLAGCGLLADDSLEQGPVGADRIGSAAEAGALSEAELATLVVALEKCRNEAPIVSAVVWLHTGIPPEAAGGVEEILEAMPMVNRLRYIDQEATYQEFTEYFADEPEILELVEPEQLPTSFDIDFSEGVNTTTFATELEQLEAVESVEFGPDSLACTAEAEAMELVCGQPALGFLIWMSPDASEDEVAAVSSTLAGSGLVEDFNYVGALETYEDFVLFYGEDSDIAALVDPDRLPTSFEVDFIDRTGAADERSEEIAALRSTLEPLDGVDDIAEGPVQFVATCRSAELDERDPTGDS